MLSKRKVQLLKTFFDAVFLKKNNSFSTIENIHSGVMLQEIQGASEYQPVIDYPSHLESFERP